MVCDHNFSHLFDLIRFGLSALSGLQVDQLFDAFFVKDLVVTALALSLRETKLPQ
jgi:hypothetical protein